MSDLDYQPAIRYGHSTVRVGDYLYTWGGSQDQDDLNPAQPSTKGTLASTQPQSFHNFVLVYHLRTGRWEQKATTGKPPPGITGYASAVIGKEIFYFGGCCNHTDCFPRCYHNSLYGLNVDTLNWREVSPNTSQSGPMMKEGAGMIAVQVDGEDYLVVFGGHGPSSENTPAQPSAQYSTEGFSIKNIQCTNELHYYRILTGEWISPDITGDRPPPISGFTLTSVNDSSAILFGGFSPSADYRVSDKLYVMVFNKEKLSLEISEVPNSSPENWPSARSAHSSVIINVGSIGPHLLVVGGFETSDCWLLDVTNKIWDEVSLPKLVAERYYHSLSVWNVTPNTSWVIELGGQSALSNMSVIECRHMVSKWSFDVIPLNLLQERMIKIDHFNLEDWSSEIQSQPQNSKKLQQLPEKQESQQRELELQLEYLQKMVHKTQEELKASEEELKKLNLEEVKKRAMIDLLQNSLQNQWNQQNDLSFRKQLASFFGFKQKKKNSGVTITEIDLEKAIDKKLTEDVHLMPKVKNCSEVAVQCDYLIHQTDLFDSSVNIAGQKLFDLQENSSSFYWEEFGFKLQCPRGAVSENTEVAVTAIVRGCFDLPKGTELVSAVYAISVSKPLLKPLVIELQHCVDLRTSAQAGCLKFVQASLTSTSSYHFTKVEGGSFRVQERYGSIERIRFSLYGVVAEMGNGNNNNGESTPSDTDSEYGTPTGSDNENDPPADESDLHSKQLTDTTLQNGTSVTTHHDNSEDISDAVALPGDILYTGMMYHVQKNVGNWITKYTVVRDLEVLRKYLKDNFSLAEQDDVDTFKFKQPEGILQLQLDTQQHPGWSVLPRKDPMKLCQSLVDKLDPLYSSFSMLVNAKHVAQNPLHFPIKLTGINPEMTIYINRSPPYSHSPASTHHSITDANNIDLEPQEVTYDKKAANEAITESILQIKQSQICLETFANKALLKKIISKAEKNRITDTSTGLSTDERMNKLLELVAVAIQFKGKVFGDFLDILREEDNVRADGLIEILENTYKRKVNSS